MLTLTVFLEWELLYPFYRQKQRLKSQKLSGKCRTGTIFSESQFFLLYQPAEFLSSVWAQAWANTCAW